MPNTPIVEFEWCNKCQATLPKGHLHDWKELPVERPDAPAVTPALTTENIRKLIADLYFQLPADEPQARSALRRLEDHCVAQASELYRLREAQADLAPRAPMCGGCGGPHPFDTSVPSVLWNRVVRPLGISEYLCTSCVIRAFAKAGVSFAAELYGDGFSGLAIAVEINGVQARTAQLLQDENNDLRSALSQISDRARETLKNVTEPRPQETP